MYDLLYESCTSLIWDFLQTSYKKEFEKGKSKSNFNVTDTQQYNAIKEGEKTSNVRKNLK